MDAWGDGTVARSKEEAEWIWGQVKILEKEERRDERENGEGEGGGTTESLKNKVWDKMERVGDLEVEGVKVIMLAAGACVAGVGFGVIGLRLLQRRGIV